MVEWVGNLHVLPEFPPHPRHFWCVYPHVQQAKCFRTLAISVALIAAHNKISVCCSVQVCLCSSKYFGV